MKIYLAAITVALLSAAVLISACLLKPVSHLPLFG
jgi:hypothetical protein